jgi:hypothetical protein
MTGSEYPCGFQGTLRFRRAQAVRLRRSLRRPIGCRAPAAVVQLCHGMRTPERKNLQCAQKIMSMIFKPFSGVSFVPGRSGKNVAIRFFGLLYINNQKGQICGNVAIPPQQFIRYPSSAPFAAMW